MSWLLAESSGHAHPTWADFTPTTWIMVVLMGIAAGWSVWKAVMYTLRPGEQEPDHIKRLILEDGPPAGAVRTQPSTNEQSHA